MNVATQELEDTKYPHLRVMRGGNGPPKAPSKDWLSELPEGTVFVCRHKNNQDVDLNLYCVVFKSPMAVLLTWRLPDGKMLDYHVDPVRFSEKFEQVTVLGKQGMGKEEDNDCRECDSHRPGDVLLHEAVSGVDQVVQEAEQTVVPDGDQPGEGVVQPLHE